MTDLLTVSGELGLGYGLLVLGMYVSFRVLRFPDLTVDGSFTLGGALCATLLSRGADPFTATAAAALAGAAAGAFTGFLYSYLHINKILSGVLTLTMLYSVNLRILGGPNLPLPDGVGLTGYLQNWTGWPSASLTLSLFLVVALSAKLALDSLLRTEVGLVLRATGDNTRLVRGLGRSPEGFRLLGMALANALVAVSGTLLVQGFGFADIGLGTGALTVGFASLLLGEGMLRPSNVRSATLAALVGSCLYQLLLSAALRLGLAPSDLKLVTGAFVIILLVLQERR